MEMAGQGPDEYVVLSVAAGAMLSLSLGGSGGNEPSRTEPTVKVSNTLGNSTLFPEAESDAKVERLRFLQFIICFVT